MYITTYEILNLGIYGGETRFAFGASNRANYVILKKEEIVQSVLELEVESLQVTPEGILRLNIPTSEFDEIFKYYHKENGFYKEQSNHYRNT